MKRGQVNSSLSYNDTHSNKNSSNYDNSRSSEKKHKYLVFIKEQQDLQRQKVKEQIHKKLANEKKHKEDRLKHQLEKKRKQLQELEREKLQGEGYYNRGFQLAKVKEENDQIKKQLKAVQAQANNTNSEFRYLKAMKWLEKENEQRSENVNVALNRRRTIQESEKVQRRRASQYKKQKQLEQSQRVPQQPVSFKEYKEPLGRDAYVKNYSACLSRRSNPILVVKEPNTVEKEAEALAEGKHALKRAESVKRQCVSQRNQKVANQRYKAALLKMKREQQFSEYQRDAQKTAIQYNLDRLKVGKVNQYAGIKPATMEQMKTNKVSRSELEFEKTFLNKNNPEFKANRVANKYEIVQARSQNFNNMIRERKENHRIKSKNNTSAIAQISQGKYSFESSNRFAGRNKTESNHEVEQERDLRYIQEQEQISHDQSNGKNQPKVQQLTPEVIKQYRKQKRQKVEGFSREDQPRNVKKTQKVQEVSKREDIIKTRKLQNTNCELSNVCQNKYQYEEQSQDSDN